MKFILRVWYSEKNLTSLQSQQCPQMTPKDQDSCLTKPVPTKNGQEIFADNLGAAGADVTVSSNDPFI